MRHPLEKVFELARTKRVWFSAKSKSVWAVMKVFENQAEPMTEVDAERFILNGLLTLTPDDFVESVIQWGDSSIVADVYGIVIANRPWYVKFVIDGDGELEEISFHPPLRDLKTCSSRVVKSEAQNEK